MALKMKNTAYYKKKMVESEAMSPYNKSSFTDNGELRREESIKRGPQQPDGTYLNEEENVDNSGGGFDESAVNLARRKRISKRMANPNVKMPKWRKNLARMRKMKEEGKWG